MIEACACGGCVGYWLVEHAYPIPYDLQGGLHAPCGCVRFVGPKSGQDHRRVLQALTGFPYSGMDRSALYQALMSHLSRQPAYAASLGVVLPSPKLAPGAP